MKWELVFLLGLISLPFVCGENQTIAYNFRDFEKKKSEHFLVSWKAWQMLSGVGSFGTLSNSFLLYTFYSERKVLATSVNTMVCMDTLYRFLYSTFAIHWRTYNMVSDRTLFQGLLEGETVTATLSFFIYFWYNIKTSRS